VYRSSDRPVRSVSRRNAFTSATLTTPDLDGWTAVQSNARAGTTCSITSADSTGTEPRTTSGFAGGTSGLVPVLGAEFPSLDRMATHLIPATRSVPAMLIDGEVAVLPTSASRVEALVRAGRTPSERAIRRIRA
jgi:hypothetical protein